MSSVSRTGGAPTLAEQREAADAAQMAKAAGHPLVRAVLDAFPGASIAAVRDLAGQRDAVGEAEAEAEAEDEDEDES